ncbi:hypothetical protein LPJ53_006401, partial [Coemansia erecta]
MTRQHTAAKPQDRDSCLANVNDALITKRRERLARQLTGHNQIDTTSEMLVDFGLNERYDRYELAVGDTFLKLAEVAPIFSKAGLKSNPEFPDETKIFSKLMKRPLQKSGEAALVQSGMASVSTFLEAKADASSLTISSENLGQLADYASAIWACQPTRKFVPAFFLHSSHLWLILFFRDAWVRVDLGDICYTVESGIFNSSTAVHSTLKVFWFLLTLPAKDFGHFCDVTGLVTRLRFRLLASGNGSAIVENVLTNISDQKDLLRKVKPIHQPVSIYGNVAYLYKAAFNGQDVILKMAWARVGRTSEGAVYDLLHRREVLGVPVVYDSGILIPDFRGFRLEYLIVEDCGQRIFDSIDSIQKEGLGQIVKSLVEQVSECLVLAHSNGILHRDISPGNIAVRDGVARVIDWGYAKIFDFSGDDAQEVANKWLLDTSAAMREDDTLTGTVLYMSVGVLSQARGRRLLDDIESLFYVILRSFSKKPRSKDELEPVCFRFYDSENLAAVRASKLTTPNWLKHFGVDTSSIVLNQLFNAMHKVLFWKDGRFIGHELILQNGPDRKIDIKAARPFINERT